MNSKKILVIRLQAIGDVVHSTIIPYAIKLKYPDYKIDYLTRQNMAQILENCPYVDKIHFFNGNIDETARVLRKEKYDAVINLNHTLKNYFLCALLFPAKICNKSNLGNSWVENYFYTAKKIFKDIELPDRLYLENTDTKLKQEIETKLKSYPKPHVFLNPGVNFSNPRQGRVWNIENWKALSEKLLEKYGGTIFVTGSSLEKSHHIQLESERVIILSGLFNLKESCAALSMADLVISGDSGPVHIASAYNVKTIAILGSTSPDKIKPYGKNGFYLGPKTECKYCWQKKCKYTSSKDDYTPCIESIKPYDVIEFIKNNNLL